MFVKTTGSVVPGLRYTVIFYTSVHYARLRKLTLLNVECNAVVF